MGNPSEGGFTWWCSITRAKCARKGISDERSAQAQAESRNIPFYCNVVPRRANSEA